MTKKTSKKITDENEKSSNECIGLIDQINNLLDEKLKEINSKINSPICIKTLVVYITDYIKVDGVAGIVVGLKEEELGFLPERYSYYETNWEVVNYINFPIITNIEHDLKFIMDCDNHNLGGVLTYSESEEKLKVIIDALKTKEEEFKAFKYNAIMFVNKYILDNTVV